MKKAWKHTALALLLALIFVFGSMAGMNLILAAREKTLLSERGNAIVQSPVWAWQEEKKNSGKTEIEGEGLKEAEKKAGEDIRQTIELREMEQAIYHWEHYSYEISHSPLKGQISMEEAIEKGSAWLQAMGFWEVAIEGVFQTDFAESADSVSKAHVAVTSAAVSSAKDLQQAPDKESVKSEESGEASTDADKKIILHSLSASLNVGKRVDGENVPPEPYLSFWSIWFSNEKMTASFKINAVTGEVWEATLLWYGTILEELPILLGERLRRFAELAGVQPMDGPYMDLDGNECYAFLRLQDTNMYAKMESHKVESRSVIGDREEWELGQVQEGIMVTYNITIN